MIDYGLLVTPSKSVASLLEELGSESPSWRIMNRMIDDTTTILKNTIREMTAEELRICVISLIDDGRMHAELEEVSGEEWKSGKIKDWQPEM